MVAFSPRRRRVMQAARLRPGAARPDPARPRPGGGSAGPAGRGGGCGHRWRRPRTALTRLLPARRRPARVSARGRQAGGGPSPRHRQPPISASVRAARSGASRAAPHSLALTPARTPARDPARALGGQGHSAPSTHAAQDGRGAEQGPAGRTPALSRACPHFLGSVHTGQTPVGKDTSSAQKRVQNWAEAPTAHICRTHVPIESWLRLLWHCTTPQYTHIPNSTRGGGQGTQGTPVRSTPNRVYKHAPKVIRGPRAPPSPQPSRTHSFTPRSARQDAPTLARHPQLSKVTDGTVCSPFLSGHTQAHSF